VDAVSVFSLFASLCSPLGSSPFPGPESVIRLKHAGKMTGATGYLGGGIQTPQGTRRFGSGGATTPAQRSLDVAAEGGRLIEAWGGVPPAPASATLKVMKLTDADISDALKHLSKSGLVA
jgi:hypothetical protein